MMKRTVSVMETLPILSHIDGMEQKTTTENFQLKKTAATDGC